MSARPPLSLDEARRRLKDLGYLEGRVDRFVFRRAFEGRGGLLLPAMLLGAFGAALASVAAIESSEPGFGASLSAVGAVGVHLFAANLIPAALAVALAAILADRARAPGAGAAALGVAAALAVLTLWVAGVGSLAHILTPRAVLWGIPVGAAAALAAGSARSGFLARAYAHAQVLPSRRRGRIVLAVVSASLVLGAALLLAPAREAAAVPPPRPSSRSGDVVVLAIDGLHWDADTPSGASAEAARFLSRGATGWWAAAPASPPEIWMDLATGEPPDRHGVRALERVRPLGSPLAVRAPFGTAWYLRRLGPAIGLVTSAPVSAADRRSLAFWEVAASAGLPALAVGWWASGPWPGALVVGNEEILAGAADGLEADRRAREIFLARSAGQRIQTVYLPGLDILRSDPDRRQRALRLTLDFLREVGEAAQSRGATLIVLAADSHAAIGTPQRMVVFDGAGAATIAIRPEDVAPSILARAGIPCARDLPGRPVAALFAPGSLDTATVPTYGPRIAPAAVPARRGSDREYLEKLKSLGYLN